MRGVMSEDFPRTLLEVERRFSSEDGCSEYLAALAERMGVPRGAREPMPVWFGEIAGAAIIAGMRCPHSVVCNYEDLTT